MQLCVSDLVTGIAGVLPEREAVVDTRTGRRIVWSAFDTDIDAVARALVDVGLGCRGEPAMTRRLADRIRSPHDHVGLLCGNSVEHVTFVAGAFRARVLPVNLNWRYTASELAYVCDDADLRAVAFQPRFADALAEAVAVARRTPQPCIVLPQADDAPQPSTPQGRALVDEAVPWDRFVADGAASSTPLPTSTADDRYLIYTGGTTGFPKGVLWRQEDWYLAALGGASRGVTVWDEAVARAARSRPLPGIAASPFMHGAGLWGAFAILLQGGTLVLPPRPDTLDAAGIWHTVDDEGVVFLQIVGDAFLGPLLDELDRGDHDASALRFVTSSGAIASPARKAALQAHLPAVRILDTMGASETGAAATADTRGYDVVDKALFTPAPNARVVALDDPTREADVDAEGLLAVAGHVPLGYFGDPARTRATFPVVDGVRVSIPGDHAVRLASGQVLLLGRGNQCINSGGEKVFPEEVEAVLKSHPAVADALVAGCDDDRFGQVVGAVVGLRTGAEVDVDELAAHVRGQLAGYKVPRRWVCTHGPVQRTQVGKPDYTWARAVLADAGTPG